MIAVERRRRAPHMIRCLPSRANSHRRRPFARVTSDDMRTDLERFFNPRAIAIIGASQDFGTISGQPLKHLQSHDYTGKLYPVNPRYQEVGGAEVLSVARRRSRDAGPRADPRQRFARRRHARAVRREGRALRHHLQLGFLRSRRRRRRPAARARARSRDEHDIGVIGPNCQGMINIADGVFAGFGSVFGFDYDPGPVSMVSQSGGFGFSVMNLSSKDGGLAFRQMVTTGNEIGVSTLDFIEYFIRDPEDRDHRRLRRRAEGRAAGSSTSAKKRCSRASPSSCGKSATPSRASAPRLRIPRTSAARWRSTARRSGRRASSRSTTSRTSSISAARSSRGGCPRATASRSSRSRAAPGILMTDEIVAGGMELAKLAPETLDKLRGFIPVVRLAPEPGRRDRRDLQRSHAHQPHAAGDHRRPGRRLRSR